MGRPKQFDPDVAVGQAMEVFWRKGYAATTPQDLVEALGIGKGSLYNAFGSKHTLFELALKRYGDGQARALNDVLEAPGPVRERLRAALMFAVEFNLADPGRRGCLAVNSAAELAGADEVATELIRRMFDGREGDFLALIKEGQRSGEIDPDRDPRAIASLFLNTLVGLQLLSRTAEGPERLTRVVDALMDSL